ncbi:biotin--[acetyl-CoA-carboxylase] ligase [Pararcticibacter amylolyticus]|uniref:biotin--[acetyl-CoA-carboxylase] ligase n=1 Tax=Pararcticibacter amylolyticus TaxID=2173175 RepID=UPI00374362CC
MQRVDSTNNFLRKELSKSKPIPEGTVIMAEDQFAGRGQHNNTWTSEPGKNLTFSFVLYPVFLPASQQFLLNIAVSIAINDALTQIIGSACKIKWPNDVFYQDSKIGGVLIENTVAGNHLKSSIVGIGINVNQVEFADSIQNITSLKNITGNSFNIRDLMTGILEAIDHRYSELKEARNENHYGLYTGNLYRFNELHKFVIKGAVQNGRITGIDETGHLVLDIDGNQYHFGLKEIRYIL